MGKGLSSLLESGTPALVLAVAVLLGGVGYGVLMAEDQPAAPVEAGTAVQEVTAEQR